MGGEAGSRVRDRRSENKTCIGEKNGVKIEVGKMAGKLREWGEKTGKWFI